jgi:hypothetical protein
MRYVLIALSILLCQVAPACADVQVGVNIGINVPAYPELVPIPGYPVYYNPYSDSNYFFYDGLYWVYEDDSWYSSDWYDGPWILTEPVYVPVFVLRVPVRYYRRPPVYFHGWIADAPPHWGQHWGPAWESRRKGWDHWNHRYAPRPAPLPVYQRQYAGDRYPHRVEQQHAIRNENYHYQPREQLTRREFQQQNQQPNRLRIQQGSSQNSQSARPQGDSRDKPQVQYYRGGQGNARDEGQSQQHSQQVQPPAVQPLQSPPQGNSPAAGAVGIPNSQNNHFQSGGRRNDRGDSRIDRPQNSQGPTGGTPVPIQNNHFESGARDGRYRPQDGGNAQNRGSDRGGDGRRQDNRGGGRGPDRR